MTIGATDNAVDFAAIKSRQRMMWSSGDYGVVASRIQFMSELLCEELDLHAGERVLDVATGTGNAALAAARRGAEVIGIDYAPSLLERARERASAERLAVEFLEADAEALPFADETFDTVVSVVGVMFAPNQAHAASELRRVCRRGGRIALVNWTPDGFIGDLLRLVGSFVAPPLGIMPPTRWGTRDGAEALLGEDVALTFLERTHTFRFESPQHFAEFFISFYGPTERAHAELDDQQWQPFVNAIAKLASDWNTGGEHTLLIPATYLEIHGVVG